MSSVGFELRLDLNTQGVLFCSTNLRDESDTEAQEKVARRDSGRGGARTLPPYLQEAFPFRLAFARSARLCVSPNLHHPTNAKAA